MSTTKMLLNFTELPLGLLSVEEYQRMAEVGILHQDEQVELIAGQIIRKMSPQGSSHAAAIRRADRLFSKSLGKMVSVQKQLPVILNNFSQPEPNIAVVKVDPLDYDDSHPTAEDVYLIVEIADSTLKSDLEVKGKEYAKSGIEDYWVLDVNHRQLYVYRQPTKDGYQQKMILGEDDVIAPREFLDCVIVVGDLLRPMVTINN
ncbi:MAG: Uma2 family endonuclease [Okeania sp. SIO2C9]|uniref:Uma2 family endonuclease n=1 Tax=Okeania sp. SIO2C9 TaxID=2607791 RepID=UPI0013BFA724|nr:Uma2 family endonuclease [Okeania sp. SIO2C9]NEQ76326.1 Uma2 family endonuclease [Okeania sp. SIO2C9]